MNKDQWNTINDMLEDTLRCTHSFTTCDLCKKRSDALLSVMEEVRNRQQFTIHTKMTRGMSNKLDEIMFDKEENEEISPLWDVAGDFVDGMAKHYGVEMELISVGYTGHENNFV